ncbi:hypothetical protein IMAU80627_01163 [Lactobacillus helveticus]|uniref:hypothetical protein n=1 Tax=Lactobacillus helveticus TaxID=1587 RepID=UPI001561F6FE|nr:hypothetical protein [Lactobacillus helveticus]NRN72620.1 hypothetical protein [Lactobacillus helveticus]
MKIKRNSGYSKGVTEMYIPHNAPTYSLSTKLTKQVKWVDGKPTDKVTGYQAWFIAEGTEPFKVKFTNNIKLPAMLTMVEFQNLEACEVGNNVYFRAEEIKEVK